MSDDKVCTSSFRKTPIFIKKLESQNVCEGSRFEFMCQIEHHPNISVHWLKDGRPSLPDKYETSEDGGIHKLWCEAASPNDAGRFVCVVRNEFCEKRCMASLTVIKRIQQSSSGAIKSLNSLKTLTKMTSDANNPDLGETKVVMVTKQDVTDTRPSMIDSVGVHPNTPSSTKMDETTTASPHDNLECLSKCNELSGDVNTFCGNQGLSEEINLRIDIEDKQIKREVPTHTNSLKIFDETIESHKGTSTCNALELESGTSKPPEVLYLLPEDLHVDRGSNIELTASFRSLSHDLLKVKWFRGTVEIVDDERICINTRESISTLNILGSLPVDSECYTILVENKFGFDELSSSVTVEDRPEPPFGQPAVTSITSNSMVLSWYGPVFDGASPLLGYRIEQLQLMNDIEREWTTINEDCQHTTYLVTNLDGDSRYKFRISCRNRHGFSQPGESSEDVPTPKSLCEGNESLSTTLPIPVSLKPDRNFHDNYELGQVLGRGKFGIVQECFDKHTKQKFAAKILKLNNVVDFREEVKVMNKLRHPKLLQLWDAFEDSKEAILVMELIKGQELLERITTDDYTLTEGDCIYYVKQICQGVDYMHKKNIIHLDLKLENVLCLAEPSKEIKIIDFGLSRTYRLGESLKVMFGTPEFVAPEVLNYDPVSPLSDMWGIGVITYILLSGFSPFSGDTDSETLCNVTKALYDYEEGFDEVSDKAKQFMDSLLIKDPNKRMTSTECLQHDWLSGGEADKVSIKLCTLQHRKLLNRRRWQKSGNALRALSRLTGDSKIFSRPRGLSVDRKTFLGKLLGRNPSKDPAIPDCVFDLASPSVQRTHPKDHRRTGSMGCILERQISRSLDSLTDQKKEVIKHTDVAKVRSCVGPSC